MHADGASSRQHCGGGVMLITPEGFRLYYALRYRFLTSNNEAEYKAVLNGLRLAKALGVERLRIKTDSRLVVGQISGTCETKNARMVLYKERAVEMLKGFGAYEIEYIPRTDNTEADLLSKIALEGVPDHLIKICQKEELHRPSVGETPPEVQQVDLGEWDRGKNPEMFWIEDIRRFIEKGELPEDPGVAAKVRRKAPSFRIIDEQLYKQSFGGPLLKCGICQAFARKDTRPATFYTPVTTAIPFAKWGIDLLGPLPVAPGGLKFCVVAIDYFTKWVEAEPLATITEYQCQRFLWKRVICHIVSDNGRQFDCQAFADFCRRHGIKHTKVSVAYPQANGQVENRRATGESPFSLAYSFEAKVPVEVVEPTHRVCTYSDAANEESLRIEKNFLEERREAASVQMVEYQQAVKRYRDRRTRPRTFQVGDLVLRDRQASQPTEGGKFAVKWDGPYRIAAVVQAGTYKLETMEGKLIDRIWNATHLKRFYQ
ncbi:PREDICTED: uncharacterized protein LOC109160615 [Ipomoea nil]|uniref:uncharacterized protein LOC109160615 n=1 Tax=Ipomoea nil TaxID=35883 RepID=UPI000900EEAE|nr:PREDICTED: uncharacterized protein LOC109160615 [Ipomoea nil]